MKNITKCGIILAAVCCLALAGCSAETKIGNTAQKYMKEKYGISPTVKTVELRHVSELEPTANKKKGGTVTMEYEGREFKVSVSLEDKSLCADNYMKDEFIQSMTAYFSDKLDYEDIYLTVWYGLPGQYVGKDIKTYDDLTEKCENIQIIISTCGLDSSGIDNIDASVFGENAEIYIADWKDDSHVRAGYDSIVWGTEPPALDVCLDLTAYYSFHDGTVDRHEYKW